MQPKLHLNFDATPFGGYHILGLIPRTSGFESTIKRVGVYASPDFDMALGDILRPKWKHSNPKIRLEAVTELTGQDSDKLAEIATTDEDPEIRLAAVARIDDQATLEQISAIDTDSDVLDALTVKIDQHLRSTILDSSDVATCQPILERISSEDVLSSIALDTEHDDIRLATAKRIMCPTLLSRLTIANTGKAVGLHVVERIDDDTVLERIARDASNGGVRQAAQKKIDGIIEERNRPSAEQLRETELQDLYDTGRKLMDSWNWEFAFAKFKELRSRWADLDPGRKDPRRSGIDHALDELHRRHQEFLEVQAQDRKRAELRAYNLAEREGICSAVEALIGRVDETAVAELDRHRAEWETAPEVPDDEYLRLQIRIDTAAQAFHDTTLLQRAEQKAHDDAMPILQTLCNRAAELSTSEAFADLESQLDKLTEEMAAVECAGDDADAVRTTFDTTITTARTRLTEHREEVAQAKADNLKKLEEICTAFEAIIGAEDIAEIETPARELQTAWSKVGMVDNDAREPLEKRFKKLSDKFRQRSREFHRGRDLDRWANLTQKQDLCTEAEALAKDSDYPKMAKAIQDLHKRWKTIGPAPREQSDDIWKRFKTACDEQYSRCQAFFGEQDKQRKENLEQKQKLLDEFTGMMDDCTKDAAKERAQAIQAEWKAIGHVPKISMDINKRFHEVCNEFFEKRREHYKIRSDARKDSRKRKEDLSAQAEALKDSEDWGTATDAMKRLQADWKAAGPCERKKEEKLWERFSGACQHYFDRLNAHHDERDKERVGNYEKKLELCTELDAILADDTGGKKKTAIALVELHNRFREIGPVPRKNQDEIRSRFIAPCDTFFQSRRDHFEKLKGKRDANLKMREALIEQAETIAESTAWRETTDEFKELQTKWKTIGSVPQEIEKETWERFKAANDSFFDRRHKHYDGVEKERYENLKRKEDICTRLETLADVKPPEEETSLNVAEQLQIAFESNFIKKSADDSQSAWRVSLTETRKLQDQWERTGHVPREFDRTIWKRYKNALDQFYAQKPESEKPRESKEEMQANLETKTKLCKEAEALAAGDDPAACARDAKRLAGRFKKAGRVPSKKQADELGDRFFGAVGKIFDAARAADDSQRRA